MTGGMPEQQPSNAPVDEEVRSEPVAEGPGGKDVVIDQENVGRENMQGSGEWPDPDTPPPPSAGGEAAPASRQNERTAVKDALEADPVRGGSASGGSVGEDH